MADKLAEEFMDVMTHNPENRLGILTTFINRARKEERDRCAEAVVGWLEKETDRFLSKQDSPLEARDV